MPTDIFLPAGGDAGRLLLMVSRQRPDGFDLSPAAVEALHEQLPTF